MGKPLYTTMLLSRYDTQAAQPEPPKHSCPGVENWSPWNAFDPDSDEFFEADNAVYEAFLSDEEMAERARAQQRQATQLLSEGPLSDASSNSSGTPSEDSDGSTVGNEVVDASRRPIAQIEATVETYTSIEGFRGRDGARETQQNLQPEGQPPRRQPRRMPAISEWRLVPTDELSPPSSVEVVIPRISVVPAALGESADTPSRSPSPSPPNFISGLQYRSDSPRPLNPTESPTHSISPIPNTPARVSGVFASLPPSGRAVIPPAPAPTITPRILTWGPRLPPQWVSDSPATREASHYLGTLISSASTPLTS